MDVKTRAHGTFPEGIPALMTLTDFARACGISTPTAKKMLDKDPKNNYVHVAGEKRMVPARLLFEYLGPASASVVSTRCKKPELRG